MWIYLPFDPCPCGSNKRALSCCLARGHYFRHPAPVRRPALYTNLARRRCFLSFWRDCSRRLTGEHYISEAVLRATIPCALQDRPLFRAPPWAPELKGLPISALTANILCESHNQMFSPLDAQAGQLWSAMRDLIDVDIDPRTTPRFRLFSGHDIERWMLKTILSTFHAGYKRQNDGALLRLPVPVTELARKFLDVSLWNDNSGLYIDTKVERTNSFLFHSWNASDGMIVAAEFYMFGVRMIFLPWPVDDVTVIVPTSARHRPDGIAFRVGEETKFIGLSWNDKSGPDQDWIQLTRGPLRVGAAAA